MSIEASEDVGKIKLVTYPPLPSKCAVCLRGADGQLQFIDFELSFDFEGAVTICVACWAPVAQILGYLEPAKVQILKDQVTVLHARVEELQTENGLLNTTLDSLFTVRPALVSNDSGANASVHEGIEESAQQSLFDDAGLDQPIDFSKSGTDKSDSKRGPEDLPKPRVKL